MNTDEMRPSDKKTDYLMRSSLAGPAFDPSIPTTEDTALHPPLGRKERLPRRLLPEDVDFREYYRLR